jgi:hypothetical protein
MSEAKQLLLLLLTCNSLECLARSLACGTGLGLDTDVGGAMRKIGEGKYRACYIL